MRLVGLRVVHGSWEVIVSWGSVVSIGGLVVGDDEVGRCWWHDFVVDFVSVVRGAEAVNVDSGFSILETVTVKR